METESTTQQNLSQPMPQINKNELATEIVSYIIHSRYIILQSPHMQYRNLRILAHLDLCVELQKMLKDPSHTSLKDICQYTLMLRKHLVGILPSINNNSYESSNIKLNGIFEKCTSYLKSTQSHG